MTVTTESLASRLKFEDVSWDFADSSPAPDLHPYPCRFIPEIPRTALDILQPSGPVLDPFCGSGTTLTEAASRGHDAIGVDLNPIACLISRVKTTPWSAEDGPTHHAHAALLREHALSATQVPDWVEEAIPRVDHWFEEWSQVFLGGAVSYVRSLAADDPWRDRLALAVSAAVVRISRQESDTRYAAVDKDLDRDAASRILLESVQRIAYWLDNHQPDMTGRAVTISCRDARQLDWIDESSIGAAVFSPPYPNAYEYWLYHKYRMYWLGFDPISLRSSELGARPHYSKPNGLTEHDFAIQMSDVFAGLRRVLKSRASALVVVGDSRIRGEKIDNGKLLTDVAVQNGFSLTHSAFRLIRQSSFNRAHSRARSGEHVLVFEAP